ncbi:MAG: glycosyltransferase [candidate division Zixibacteria bacterium]|nr:glycosyltransferase [candidate division Zixibacteria bacterium]
MRVLLLADGRSVHTERFRQGLLAQGIRVVLASLESGTTVDIQLKRKTAINSLNYFLSSGEIAAIVKRTAPDLINPHFASGYGFAAARSKKSHGKPLLLHCLGSDILISPEKSFLHRKRVAFALSRADHLVVDSHFLADQVRKLHPAENISIIPWGVENDIIKLFEKRVNRHNPRQRPLRVLVPRPHNYVYNNSFIIRALAPFIIRGEISLTFPDWGSEIDSFRALVKRECPKGNVHYYSFMPHEKYTEFLAQFDYYLSASVSDSSPASLLEAMGAGLFPIVSDIPGVKEWVGPGNAILFNPNNPDSLKQGFERLINDQIDLDPILEENHLKIKESAIFAENIRSTIQIMERLISHAS